jgi:predicted O-methyltransferase YrrM
VTCLWGSSHDAEVAAAVISALDGAPLDLLFLDGDHSADGVRRDFDMYAPLVRPGGIIALHDIDGDGGVPALWRAERARGRRIEFVDRIHPPQGLGIGVLVKE